MSQAQQKTQKQKQQQQLQQGERAHVRGERSTVKTTVATTTTLTKLIIIGLVIALQQTISTQAHVIRKRDNNNETIHNNNNSSTLNDPDIVMSTLHAQTEQQQQQQQQAQTTSNGLSESASASTTASTSVIKSLSIEPVAHAESNEAMQANMIEDKLKLQKIDIDSPAVEETTIKALMNGRFDAGSGTTMTVIAASKAPETSMQVDGNDLKLQQLEPIGNGVEEVTAKETTVPVETITSKSMGEVTTQEKQEEQSTTTSTTSTTPTTTTTTSTTMKAPLAVESVGDESTVKAEESVAVTTTEASMAANEIIQETTATTITPAPPTVVPVTASPPTLADLIAAAAANITSNKVQHQTSNELSDKELKQQQRIGNGSGEKRGKFINDNSTNAQQLFLPDTADAWSLAGMKMVPKQNQSQTLQQQLNVVQEEQHTELPTNSSQHMQSSNSEKNLLAWTQIMANKDLANEQKLDKLQELDESESEKTAAHDSLTTLTTTTTTTAGTVGTANSVDFVVTTANPLDSAESSAVKPLTFENEQQEHAHEEQIPGATTTTTTTMSVMVKIPELTTSPPSTTTTTTTTTPSSIPTITTAATLTGSSDKLTTTLASLSNDNADNIYSTTTTTTVAPLLTTTSAATTTTITTTTTSATPQAIESTTAPMLRLEMPLQATSTTPMPSPATTSTSNLMEFITTTTTTLPKLHASTQEEKQSQLITTATTKASEAATANEITQQGSTTAPATTTTSTKTPNNNNNTQETSANEVDVGNGAAAVNSSSSTLEANADETTTLSTLTASKANGSVGARDDFITVNENTTIKTNEINNLNAKTADFNETIQTTTTSASVSVNASEITGRERESDKQNLSESIENTITTTTGLITTNSETASTRTNERLIVTKETTTTKSNINNIESDVAKEEEEEALVANTTTPSNTELTVTEEQSKDKDFQGNETETKANQEKEEETQQQAKLLKETTTQQILAVDVETTTTQEATEIYDTDERAGGIEANVIEEQAKDKLERTTTETAAKSNIDLEVQTITNATAEQDTELDEEVGEEHSNNNTTAGAVTPTLTAGENAGKNETNAIGEDDAFNENDEELVSVLTTTSTTAKTTTTTAHSTTNAMEVMNATTARTSTITTTTEAVNVNSIETTSELPEISVDPTQEPEIYIVTQKTSSTTTTTAASTMLPSLIPDTTTTTAPSTTTTNHVHISSVNILNGNTNLHANAADSGGTDVNVIIAITVSCVGVVALILLVAFLYLMRKRQKQMSYGQRCRPVSLDAYSLDNVSVLGSVRRKTAYRASKRTYGNAAFDDPSLRHNVLNAQELAKFVERRSSIFEEFRDVPQIIARADEVPPGCEDKNRYANVVPLPETRVILQQQNDDEKSEYINANYVRGPRDPPNYYIACQAPLESTVADFWRMIWEQQSRVIVQATDLIENGIDKCAEYLPPSVTLDNHTTYGDYQVTLKNREVKDKYAISTLLLRNMLKDESRELTHYWYKWPETGVPNEEAPIIAMLLEARSSLKTYAIEQANELKGKSSTLTIKSVSDTSNVSNAGSVVDMNGVEKKMDNSLVMSGSSSGEINGNLSAEKLRITANQGPLTVHCSPGTGRTGTIISIDMAIRSLETPKRCVDIPQLVYYVRRGRASAVQTKEQYEFIYKVAQMYAAKITNLSNEN